MISQLDLAAPNAYLDFVTHLNFVACFESHDFDAAHPWRHKIPTRHPTHLCTSSKEHIAVFRGGIFRISLYFFGKNSYHSFRG